MYRRPALMLERISVSENGITAHAASAGPSDNIGAMKNSQRFAPVGTTISLNSILSTSANGCSKPSGPTRLGPMRTWIQPITLRSASVRYATERISGIAMAMILVSVQMPGQTGRTTDHTGSHHGPQSDWKAFKTCCSIMGIPRKVSVASLPRYFARELLDRRRLGAALRPRRDKIVGRSRLLHGYGPRQTFEPACRSVRRCDANHARRHGGIDCRGKHRFAASLP